MAASVRLILGPPGTGKTTRLLSMIEDALRSGIPAERIGFVSFSRRAIREAADRLGADEETFPHFRTIHSTAFRLLELQRGDVMQKEHYQQFAEMIGIPITAGMIEDPSGFWEGTLADQALGLVSRARARQTSLQSEWRFAKLARLTWESASYVATNLEQFKRVNALLDFHDMIEQAEGQLPIDILFIDEAQDTSASQWALLRRITPPDCHVVIAGDDDQCVYAWSGASSDMLLRLRGEVEVLPISHRLPERIKTLADRVSSRIRQRVPKTFRERGPGGEITWLGNPDAADLQSGEWLLLARSNYQLHQLRRVARSQGVVYSLPSGEWSWSLPAVRAARVYEELRKGHEIKKDELGVLNRYLDQKIRITASTHRWGDFWGESALEIPWFDALSRMPDEDREYIRLLRRRGESLKSPGRVRIGTVHSVKGAEAAKVMLMTDISYRVQQSYAVDPDAEYRLLYVGITRAKEHLHLVRPQTRMAWPLSGPIMDGL